MSARRIVTNTRFNDNIQVDDSLQRQVNALGTRIDDLENSNITFHNITATGTISTTGLTNSGSETVAGNFNVGDGNFTVDASTGNTDIGGTLGVDGAVTLDSTLNAGATTVSSLTSSGALNISGSTALTGDFSVSVSTGDTASIAMSTNGGTSERITLTNTQGTSGSAINITATAGGVNVASNGSSNVNVNCIANAATTNINAGSNTGNTNIGNTTGTTTIVGNYSVTGSGTLANASVSTSFTSSGTTFMPSLASTGSSMVRQPYMPYDEVMIYYNYGGSSYSTTYQTNWLAGSWGATVTRNSVGDYTFTFTPSNYGSKTFGNVMLTSFVPNVGNSYTVSQQQTSSLHCTVFIYNSTTGASVDATSGYYVFRILNTNQSNTV